MKSVVDGAALLERAHGLRDEYVAFLTRLVEHESPTDVPDSQAGPQAVLTGALEELGYRVGRVGGRTTGGHLVARPSRRVRGRPVQLLVGHTDTVWPLGTLAQRPVRLEDGRFFGPGAFDMKGGLTQMVFALRILDELGLEPPLTPVLFVNSDEEVGSPESVSWVRFLARRARRAWILEPALGSDGKVKTSRKGVGRFTVHIQGRAAHAGLDPEAGASAILELSHVIETLHRLNNGNGTTVNVGVVEGGTRPNVVAAESRAEVDVRVRSREEGRRMESALLGLRAATPGVSLSVEGGIQVPPLEPTARNRRLWEAARRAGADVGLTLEEIGAGGGSDGNTTSLFTATLDGLGPVGDGAHAVHEHLVVEPTLDRCALLARLLLEPDVTDSMEDPP